MTTPSPLRALPRSLALAALVASALLCQEPTPKQSNEAPASPARPASEPVPSNPTPSNPAAEADAALDAAVRQRLFRKNADGVALDGYDPVSYHQKGGPKPGKKEHEFVHRGIAYWFADADNKKAFVANPDGLEPPYGGWCAYAVIDGEKVEVDATNFAIEDGKVLLFYKGFWGDALQKWHRLTKEKGAKKAVGAADEGFRRIEATDRETVVAERAKETEKAPKPEGETKTPSADGGPAKPKQKPKQKG